jgi:hypothetical protein
MRKGLPAELHCLAWERLLIKDESLYLWLKLLTFSIYMISVVTGLSSCVVKPTNAQKRYSAQRRASLRRHTAPSQWPQRCRAFSVLLSRAHRGPRTQVWAAFHASRAWASATCWGSATEGVTKGRGVSFQFRFGEDAALLDSLGWCQPPFSQMKRRKMAGVPTPLVEPVLLESGFRLHCPQLFCLQMCLSSF